MKQTLYEVLRVEPTATPEDIRYAAQRLAYKYNPKQHPNNPKVLAYFRQIQQAYRILNNAATRAAYDAKLNEIILPSAEQPTILVEPSPLATPIKDTRIFPAVGNVEIAVPPKAIHKTTSLVENTQYRAHLHWFSFVPSLLILGFSVQLLFVNPELFNYLLQKHEFLNTHPIEVRWGIIALLAYATFSFFLNFLNLFTTHLVLTNKRVIFESGLIFRTHQEFNYGIFEKILVRQGIFGSAFGFGKIYLQAFGGIHIRLRNIAAPHKFEEMLIRNVRTHTYKTLS
ncbi:MAG: DnaJ domain-containing protein [Thiotrichaceae bacterium]|nr:DnaJ domain-containing protein [Thiotrichaceae bacterium]